MRVQQFATGLVFVQQAFKDEDAEVVSHTEDKGGEDDVHNIELDPEYAHYSGVYQPSHGHRQEAEQCTFESAVREPENEEDEA